MTTDQDKVSKMTEQTYKPNTQVCAFCARAENHVINGAHLIPQATSHLTPSTLNTPFISNDSEAVRTRPANWEQIMNVPFHLLHSS